MPQNKHQSSNSLFKNRARDCHINFMIGPYFSRHNRNDQHSATKKKWVTSKQQNQLKTNRQGKTKYRKTKKTEQRIIRKSFNQLIQKQISTVSGKKTNLYEINRKHSLESNEMELISSDEIDLKLIFNGFFSGENSLWNRHVESLFKFL